MFAVLETETVPRPDWLRRVRARLRKETGVALTEEARWGTRLMRVMITHELGDSPLRREKRLLYALRTTAARGCRAAVLSRDFADEDCQADSIRALAAEAGVTMATPVSLYRRMAAPICRFGADRLGRAPRQLGIAVCARRMTSEFLQVLQSLSLRARSLALCVEGNTAAIARSLRAQYGISVLENPSPAQLDGTDIYLVFDAEQAARHIAPRAHSLIIWLDGTDGPAEEFRAGGGTECLHCNGAHFRFPARLESAGDLDEDALLTVLAASGAVSFQELTVRELLWNGEILEI